MAKAHFVPLLLRSRCTATLAGLRALIQTEHSGKAEGGQMPVDFSGNGYLATDAAVVVDAFERALEKLVVDRRDPEALVVAKHIITFAKAGERDPERLHDLTVKAVRNEWRRAESFGASAGDQLSSGTDSVWNALPGRS